MQTKCNIVILMQQRMYASMRKTVRMFDLEFVLSNCSCKDNTKTHSVIHKIILIGMFNSTIFEIGRIFTKIFTIMLAPLNF